MMGNKVSLAISLFLVTLSFNTQAENVDFDRWHIKAGLGHIEPKSGNGNLTPGTLDVGSSLGPTATISYFVEPNWAIDVLLGLPFKHDLSIGGNKIGSTKHLPPTVSLQYHFNPTGSIRPYVGLGVNYTALFSEKLVGAGDLQLGNSLGLAAQLGVDVPVVDKWTVGADLRYMDIDSKASLNGTSIGTVNIAPLIFGFNVGYKF